MSERNYAKEAVEIVQGQTRMIPEPEHLQAMAAQVESVLRDNKLLLNVIAAAMVDTNQSALYFPAEALANVEQQQLFLAFERNPGGRDGAMLITLKRRPAAPGPVAARTNGSGRTH